MNIQKIKKTIDRLLGRENYLDLSFHSLYSKMFRRGIRLSNIPYKKHILVIAGMIFIATIPIPGPNILGLVLSGLILRRFG